MSAIRFEAAREQFAGLARGSRRHGISTFEPMPSFWPIYHSGGSDAAGDRGEQRIGPAGNSVGLGGWTMDALHAARGAVGTLVLRSAPVLPAPNLSKVFQHPPEWRKFVRF